MRCIGILEMSSTFLVSDESELIFIERVKLAYLECEHIARRESSSFFRSFRVNFSH